MRRKRGEMTRRDFIRGAAGVAVAGSVSGLALAGEEEKPRPASTSKKPRVVLVRDEKALSPDGKPNGEVLDGMLDEAVATLLDKPDPVTAWKSLVKPSDTVGIKSNVWGYLATPPEVEAWIRRRLIDAGVAEDKIGVDDRGVLRNPIFGRATALVNVRPMRTHHWSGVGSLIKNYIMFHEDPPSWHGDSCADLAGLWDLPLVKGKTRLNILVMLTPLFQSKGPHGFNKKYTWPYKGFLMGTDPVATDAIGLRILEARRLEYFGKSLPFNVSPKHIEVADRKFGLGVSDPSRVDLVTLGWEEGRLI